MGKNRFLDMDAYLRNKTQNCFSAPVRTAPSAKRYLKNGVKPRETGNAGSLPPSAAQSRYPAQALEKAGMQISANGIELVKKFEGFFTNLYNDPVGHCTIGYGTLVHKGNCDGNEPEEFKNGISQQRATELMVAEINRFKGIINDNVQVALTQNQFDALASFVYNVGAGAFKKSTLLQELNKGNYSSVPIELRKWVKAGGQTLPGLVKRREEEAALFMKGEPAAAQSFTGGYKYSSPYTSEQDKRPRGIRNHNPGNIVLVKNNEWEGRVPPEQNTDGHFEQFTSFAYGVRALIILLRNYIRSGRNTINKIFEAYAPPSENSTQTYIRFMAGRLNIPPDGTLSVTKNTLKELAQAIAKMENGVECITDEQFEEGYTLVPETVRSAITQSMSYGRGSGGYGFSMSANDRALVLLLENGGIDLGVTELVNKLISKVPGSGLIPQEAINKFGGYINEKIKGLTDSLLESAELAANRYGSARPEFYSDVVVLRNGTASFTDLKDTLTRLTKEGKVIDLFILTHGSSDYISVTGGINSAKIRQIKTDNGNHPIRLRSVYMMNCVGSSLNQAWLDIGAKAASGAVRNNYLPEPTMYFFWSNWKNGQSFTDAVTNAYQQTIAAMKSVIRSAGEAVLPGGGAIANSLADIDNADFVKDSAPLIQGDGSIKISSDALSFSQSVKSSALAITVMPVQALA